MGILKSIKNIFKPASEQVSDTEFIHLESTDSTNNYLRSYVPEGDSKRFTVVTAQYQSSGRGQGENTWESEKGKNLLCSILCHPSHLPLRQQFLLSEAGALAIKEAVNKQVLEGISLKWPNDIYYNDQKLSGTLIETKLSGGHIKDFILGIGLNVNQQKFVSDAPNPVSLFQILGHEVDREVLLRDLMEAFRKYYGWIEQGAYADISGLYHEALYRRKGFFTFEDKDGRFEGAIVEVEDDGHLVLRTREGVIQSYLFKEVEFII